MKLAPLLTQYLYVNKRLDLPGIGSFFLDPSMDIEPESQKHGRPVNMAGVSFESNPSIKDCAALIQFISAQTGKMRALAASDLDSHLHLAQQFLNIGKPFLFEGIGSLVKLKTGEFDFMSGEIVPEKMKDYSVREISSTSTTEDSFTNYKNLFSEKRSIVRWRRPTVVFLTIAGVAFAIWAGYTVYKTTTAKREGPIGKDDQQDQIIPASDTSLVVYKDSTQFVNNHNATPTKKDSVTTTAKNVEPGKYKFILEVANATRAAQRFARLKSFQWKIQMETKDSQAYKLFLVLPVAASDTTRILDSLTVLSGRKVRIEN